MARKTSAKTTAQATLTDDDHIAPKPSKRRASAKQVDTIPDDAPLDDLEDDSDDADHLDDFDAYSAQDDDAKTFASADFADDLNDGEYDELLDEFDEAYEDEFGQAPKHKRRSTASSKESRRVTTAENLPTLSAAQAIVPAMPTALTAPGVNLGAYINAVHQIPILTPEQEQELAHRYTDEGDLEAARLLVMSHLRFVIHIARSYSGYGLPQGDLIQEGNVGLMKAVKRFDPNKGVRLVSFAVHWIKAEIHEFVIRNWRIVKVATTKAHRKLFFNLRSLKKTNNQLTLEEAEAIAKDLNVTVKQVLEMESRLTSYDASFEAQSDDEDEGRYAPQYYLEDEANPADLVEDADWEQSNNTALQEAMLTLDDRSRDIVQQRWLNEQKSTLHELAAEYNISAERVRQIEKNAMDKIREAMLANTHLQLDLEP
ncbi:RNA polymerase sigma factor RpoH [Moraxella atlantae]|uniref:RNA polymerase sigma factor RpoH n=1 Tax=Faucicola atlantae TaxID=34059 RepID=A0A378Q6B4_9GAMM|nr:RNA polymerase sigma factor RpoH [Moraxella atlantae]STY95934.1 Heat shock regulatory protein F33.4 [Moraxella atlantae]